MIVKNKRLDLMFKKSDDVLMVCDSLTMALDTDQRLVYALIANFEHGIDVEKMKLEFDDFKGQVLQDK